MKKPEITRRLLPLLDIMMLLLSFFIIIPHGIVTKEKEQIISLGNTNENLKQQIDYYQWHFGDRKEMSGREYRTMTLVFIGNELYLKDDALDSKSWEKFNFPNWEEKIKYHAQVKKVNFAFLQIRDRQDEQPTTQKYLWALEGFLQKYQMLYILENR